MQKDILYGKFNYKEKEYPFFLVDYVVTITQTAGEHNEDFVDAVHFEHLSGVTSNHKFIILLDCSIVGSQLTRISNNLQFVCKGYVLSDTSYECYDRIEFSSIALNGFYSPRRAIEIKQDEARLGVRALSFRDYEETLQKFSCTINQEQIDCELFFRSSIVLRPEDTAIGSVSTTFSMTFSEPKSVDDLWKYYLYLQDFLVFVNFRTNVPMDDITLFSKREDGKFAKHGVAKYLQLDCSQYSADSFRSITYNDLPENTLPGVFSLVAERRERGSHNPYFIPADKKDAAHVDSAKWLVAAISFEGEFNRNYPDFKYQADAQFQQTKDLLLTTIDKEVSTSGVAINNKSNASLKSFRSLISNTDTTVKEKFQICMDKHSSEIESIVKKYLRLEGVAEDTNLAQAYSDYRNNTAHGTIMPISKVDIVTYLLLRCFIYVLILEQGKVPSEKIKEIITRLF